MLKKVLTGLVVIVFAFALAEGYKVEAAAEEKILIRLADFQGGQLNYTTAFNEIFDLYSQRHPNVEFDRMAFGWDEYNQAIKPMLASGDIPDLVGLMQGTDTILAVDAGMIIPIGNIIEADAEWLAQLGGKDFVEFTDLFIDGKIYQVGMDAITCVLLYHKNIFSDLGLEVPITIDEYKKVNEVLVANGKYLSLLYQPQDIQKQTFNLLVSSLTGSVDMVWDAVDGKISWQNSVFLDSLKDLEYVMKESALVDVMSRGGNEWFDDFTSEKCWGKWYSGEWEVGVLAELMPEKIAAGDIGIMNFPLPTGATETKAYLGGPGQTYSVAAKSENQEIALDFLKFLSSPEAAQIMTKNNIHSAGKVDDPAKYTDNPLFMDFIETYANAHLVTWTMPSAEAEEKWRDNLDLLYLGEITPKEFLQDLDAAFYNG